MANGTSEEWDTGQGNKPERVGTGVEISPTDFVPPFIVVSARQIGGQFEIWDSVYNTVHSFASEDDAEKICEMMNDRWK